MLFFCLPSKKKEQPLCQERSGSSRGGEAFPRRSIAFGPCRSPAGFQHPCVGTGVPVGRVGRRQPVRGVHPGVPACPTWPRHEQAGDRCCASRPRLGTRSPRRAEQTLSDTRRAMRTGTHLYTRDGPAMARTCGSGQRRLCRSPRTGSPGTRLVCRCLKQEPGTPMVLLG